MTLALASVVLWGTWERAGELSANQIAWSSDRGPEMYEGAVRLDLVTIDEVVDLMLIPNQIDPGFVPQPTREELLHLFETEPAEMHRIAAAVWWRGGVEPDGEVYKEACKQAYATAASEGFPPLPGDTVNCDDFDTPAGAQEWYDTHVRLYGDIARLDRDRDGVPCEDADWHIDLAFGLAADDVTYGVEWGPDTWLSDMRSGDSCTRAGSWVRPEPDFPFNDISVAIYGNPTDMMRFTFPTQLSPRGAWVHLADGTCLAVDEAGTSGRSHFYQFDDALPEFGRAVP